MSQLFYAIVALFRLVCRFTGLSYAELNILVYCALVPIGWFMIVVWRRKSLWPWLLGQLGVLLALLILRRGHLGPLGQRFYDYNIAVLEKLGHATGGGYLAVSLLMGVMIPAVSVVLLLAVPRRALVGVYLLFIGTLVTYFWLGQAVIAPPDASWQAWQTNKSALTKRPLSPKNPSPIHLIPPAGPHKYAERGIGCGAG